MNKKDVKQAAAQYAQGFIEDDYSKAEERAFIAGAEWRINSVWHDAKEKPEDDRTYLAEFDNGTCCMFYNNLYFNRMADAYHIIRWAYTDDLLLERKEASYE